MDKTIKSWRHGDLCGILLDKLPDNLKRTDTKVLLTGSHGHDHFIDNGEVYFKQVGAYIFGYLVAKDTILDHEEHGKRNLNGVYELRRQQEEHHEGLVPVRD